MSIWGGPNWLTLELYTDDVNTFYTRNLASMKALHKKLTARTNEVIPNKASEFMIDDAYKLFNQIQTEITIKQINNAFIKSKH